MSWAVYSFVQVRDHSVPPATQLVAKHVEAGRPPGENRTDAHDSTVLPMRAGWSLFNRVAAIRRADHQCGVIELAVGTTLDGGEDRFIDPPAQAHEVSAGTERNPVQLDPEGIFNHDSH